MQYVSVMPTIVTVRKFVVFILRAIIILYTNTFDYYVAWIYWWHCGDSIAIVRVLVVLVLRAIIIIYLLYYYCDNQFITHYELLFVYRIGYLLRV